MALDQPTRDLVRSLFDAFHDTAAEWKAAAQVAAGTSSVCVLATGVGAVILGGAGLVVSAVAADLTEWDDGVQTNLVSHPVDGPAIVGVIVDDDSDLAWLRPVSIWSRLHVEDRGEAHHDRSRHCAGARARRSRTLLR